MDDNSQLTGIEVNESELAKEIIASEQEIQNETVHTELGPRPLELMLSPPFDCVQCGKRCGTRRALVLHLRSHPSADVHVDITDTTGQLDSVKSELKQEVENKNENENCPTKLARSKYKRVTVKTAKGSKADAGGKVKVKKPKRDPDEPNQCEYCNKEFSCHRKLAIHIRIHTGERPYLCRFCSRGFIDPKGLQVSFLALTL